MPSLHSTLFSRNNNNKKERKKTTLRGDLRLLTGRRWVNSSGDSRIESLHSDYTVRWEFVRIWSYNCWRWKRIAVEFLLQVGSSALEIESLFSLFTSLWSWCDDNYALVGAELSFLFFFLYTPFKSNLEIIRHYQMRILSWKPPSLNFPLAFDFPMWNTLCWLLLKKTPDSQKTLFLNSPCSTYTSYTLPTWLLYILLQWRLLRLQIPRGDLSDRRTHSVTGL